MARVVAVQARRVGAGVNDGPAHAAAFRGARVAAAAELGDREWLAVLETLTQFGPEGPRPGCGIASCECQPCRTGLPSGSALPLLQFAAYLSLIRPCDHAGWLSAAAMPHAPQILRRALTRARQERSHLAS